MRTARCAAARAGRNANGAAPRGRASSRAVRCRWAGAAGPGGVRLYAMRLSVFFLAYAIDCCVQYCVGISTYLLLRNIDCLFIIFYLASGICASCSLSRSTL